MSAAEFLDKIKELRTQAGLTMRQLADAVNVSEATISRWESGNIPNMRRDKIAILAKALHTTPAYLMGWEEPATDDYSKIKNASPLPKMKKIPLIGTIACGIPIFAEENVEGYVPTPETIHADFCLRCNGDSMINARILDGDVVLIRKQPDVDDGQIVAVLVDDEATLKRVYHNKDGGVTLVAENPKYAPMTFTSADCVKIRILGKAVAFISGVK